MKKAIPFLLFFLISISLTAQNPKLEWAASFGHGSTEYSPSIAIDSVGNVYSCGHFEYITDFDPGPGVFNLTSNGGFDIFISKLDSDGNLIWVISFGETDYEYARNLTLDHLGNVIITGKFPGTVDFDPGIGIFPLTAIGDEDIFILKLDPSGNFLWARSFGNTYTEEINCLSCDPAGNIYTTGTFSSTLDFDPGIGTYNLTSSYLDAFVSKLDASGNFLWAKHWGGTGHTIATSIATTGNGNVLVAGTFQGITDFDPGPTIVSYDSNGSADMFFLKLDVFGSFIWVKRVGGLGLGNVRSICVDSVGNIYSTGYFEGSLDFDPGSGTFAQYGIGSYAQFITKYSNTGDFIWAKQFARSGNGYIHPYHIIADNAGNVYTTGRCNQGIDFDPGLGTYQITSPITYMAFVSKLDSLGDFVWALGFHGDNAITYPVGVSLALLPNGDLYSLGSYESYMDADPSPSANYIYTDWGHDAYLIKFSQPTHPVAQFSSSDTVVSVGDTVRFTDHEIGYGNSWSWDFGDGITSTLQHPQHIYQIPGSYTISFVVSDGIVSDTAIVENLIVVTNYTYTSLIAPEFSWATSNQSTNSNSWSKGLTITVDSSGNLITTGIFAGTVDFDQDTGVFEMTSYNDADIYIMKQDADGKFLWVKQIKNNDEKYSTAIKVDNNQNIYVTGYYEDDIVIDPASGGLTLDGNSRFRSFILKLDSAGNTIWAEKLSSTYDFIINSLCLDDSANIFITGSFDGNSDMDPDPASTNILSSSVGEDMFVSKLDSSGSFVWAKNIGSSYDASGNSIDLSLNGNIYITGSYWDTTDFDPGPGVHNLPYYGGTDIFILKMDGQGNFVWARGIGGQNTDIGTSIAVDNNENVIVTGTFKYTVDFDPDTTDTYELVSNGGIDIFVLKLDSSGDFDWAVGFGNPYSSSDIISDLTLDNYGNIYATGMYGIIDFDFGQGAYPFTSNGDMDLFAFKLDTMGNLAWVFSIGDSNSEQGNAIAVDKSESIFITGRYKGPYTGNVDFDPGLGTYLLNSNYHNAFVLTLDIPFKAYFTANQTNITLGDTVHFTDKSTGDPTTWYWDFGDGNTDSIQNPSHYYSSSGTYTVSLVTSDSIHTDTIIRYDVINVGMTLSVNALLSNANCFGVSTGAIDLNILNGTPPYSFIWNNGASTEDLYNIPMGTYSVDIIDQLNVTYSNNFTIYQPSEIQISALITDSVCFGAIGISVSEGYAPYQFNWSTGASSDSLSGIEAGIYGLTISDNHGCNKSDTFVLSIAPLPLSIDFNHFDQSCYGIPDGEIDLTILGGLPDSISYYWSNGANTEDLINLPAGVYEVTAVQNNYLCEVNGSIEITQPDSITVNELIENVDCFGNNTGSITINVFGGTMPYSYIWSTGFTSQDLSAVNGGIYDLTITDAEGCERIGTFTVDEPPAISVTVLITDSVCFGAINVSVSGGSSPYEFNWSTGASTDSLSGIEAGNYALTISDNNNCFKVDTFALTIAPVPLNLNFIPLDVSCYGIPNGEVDLTVLGGLADTVSYYWSNGANTEDLVNLPIGVYEVTVIQDNYLCMVNGSVEIIQPDSITPNEAIEHVDCFGNNTGSITINALGGIVPYSYIWSNGFTSSNLSAVSSGEYDLTITDANGCEQIGAFMVDEPLAISVNANVTHVQITGGNDGAIQTAIIGGTPPYGYSWNNGSINTSLTNISAGNYSLTVTDANLCTWDSSFVVLEIVNIHDLTDKDELILYQNLPNPFDKQTTFGFYLPNPTTIELVIFNSIGEKLITVFEGDLGAGEHTIPFNNKTLPDGSYLFRISTRDESKTGKLMVINR